MTVLTRTLFLFAFAVCINRAGHAQGVAIGSGTPTPAASAILDLQSTTQGLLPPRMTTAQRTAIASPATGLVVFDTNVGSLYLRTASAWVPLSTGSTGWGVTGNTGTSPATNFLGTTDAQPLVLRVNNVKAGWVGTTDANVSLGSSALVANSSGTANMAMGNSALLNNTTGAYNIAIGHQALQSATTLNTNIAIGTYAMGLATSKSNQVAIGDSTLMNNGTGATGNTQAIRNTAVGHGALKENTTGAYNVAVGNRALIANTEGGDNVAVGTRALEANTTGYNNTALGSGTLQNNFGNYGNTACGANAINGTMSGSGNNTAVGGNAMQNINGSNNTALGSNAGPPNTFVLMNNTTSIGSNATVSASNQICLGTVANTGLTGGYGAWFDFSDGRYKDAVAEDVPGLAFVTRLRPVSYHLAAENIARTFGKPFKGEGAEAAEPAWYNARLKEVSAAKQTGFIAQEVEAAAQEVGYDFAGVHHPVGEEDHYALGYSTFVVPLVKAVQEQQAMIDEQKATIAAQQRAIETLQEQVHQLMQR